MASCQKNGTTDIKLTQGIIYLFDKTYFIKQIFCKLLIYVAQYHVFINHKASGMLSSWYAIKHDLD